MKYLLSVLAVLSAPVVYGVICVPLLGVLMSLKPELINDMGGTHDVVLSIQSELLQLIILLVIGFVVASIARFKQMLHACIATALMLVIGVSIQLGYWDSMPVWHHFVFFACILLGVPAGAWIRMKMVPDQVT